MKMFTMQKVSMPKVVIKEDDSPPRQFILDPITGKVAGQEYSERDPESVIEGNTRNDVYQKKMLSLHNKNKSMLDKYLNEWRKHQLKRKLQKMAQFQCSLLYDSNLIQVNLIIQSNKEYIEVIGRNQPRHFVPMKREVARSLLNEFNLEDNKIILVMNQENRDQQEEPDSMELLFENRDVQAAAFAALTEFTKREN